jgi:hypothetical protein
MYLKDLKDLLLPTVSVLLKDGMDEIEGPLSKDVDDEVFLGVEVPDPDLEGWLPISYRVLATNTIFKFIPLFLERVFFKRWFDLCKTGYRES